MQEQRVKKFIDIDTKIYKAIADGNLSVYIETLDDCRWRVTTSDHYISLNQFQSREDAIDWCRFLGLNILAYMRYKDNDNSEE